MHEEFQFVCGKLLIPFPFPWCKAWLYVFALPNLCSVRYVITMKSAHLPHAKLSLNSHKSGKRVWGMCCCKGSRNWAWYLPERISCIEELHAEYGIVLFLLIRNKLLHVRPQNKKKKEDNKTHVICLLLEMFLDNFFVLLDSFVERFRHSSFNNLGIYWSKQF